MIKTGSREIKTCHARIPRIGIRRLGRILPCFLAVATSLHGSMAQDNARPQALETMVRQRAALSTGRVEMAQIDYERAAPKHVEPRELFYTIQFTSDAEIRINRGDENGVVILTPEGEPHPLYADVPFMTYSEAGALWQRSDRHLDMARKFTTSRESRSDVRTLGLSIANRMRTDLHQLVWGDSVPQPALSHYQESEESGLRKVTVKKSRYAETYWIDPARGWSPVRVRQDYADGNWAEARSALRDWNGAWFPEIVESYSSRYEHGDKPTRVVRVLAAEFNQPEHPQTLSPQSIGVVIGLPAMLIDQANQRTIQGYYDGTDVATPEDYIRRREAGEIHPGEHDKTIEDVVFAAHASQKKTMESLAFSFDDYEKLTPWEEYTRDFITKYQFNDEQTQKAWSLCRECQDRARDYLRGKRDVFLKIEDRTSVLGTARSDIARDEIKRLQERRESLMQPVEKIFQSELKPRLERLPTRAQRAAAEPPDEKIDKSESRRP